jgi:hypothetical protein
VRIKELVERRNVRRRYEKKRDSLGLNHCTKQPLATKFNRNQIKKYSAGSLYERPLRCPKVKPLT